MLAAISHLGGWQRGLRQARLPRALGALSGWARLVPDESQEPCPWVIAVLIARHLSAASHPRARTVAKAIIVQFACMLRPNEVLSLRSDACFGAKAHTRRYDKCAVTISPSHASAGSGLPGAPSKTGTMDDTVVFDDALTHPAARNVFLYQLASAKKRKDVLLFDGVAYRLYSVLFKKAVAELRLPPVMLHMLRHGAASEDFYRCLRDLQAIQVRGRWRSFASVQRYQKSGRLLNFLDKCVRATIAEAQRAADSDFQFLLCG